MRCDRMRRDGMGMGMGMGMGIALPSKEVHLPSKGTRMGGCTVHCGRRDQ